MSEGKHTAERWTVGRRRSGRVALVTEGGESFAGFYDFDGPEVQRRAKLAAAAPNLLAELEECAQFFSDGNWQWDDGTPFDTAKIRTAIRAAKGEG